MSDISISEDLLIKIYYNTVSGLCCFMNPATNEFEFPDYFVKTVERYILNYSLAPLLARESHIRDSFISDIYFMRELEYED